MDPTEPNGDIGGRDVGGADAPGAGGGGRRNPIEVVAEWVLLASLLLIVVPVVVLMFAALAAFAYGTNVFVHSVRDLVQHPFPVGHKVGMFILVIDLFLIGATLLIASVGFYELFISRVDLGAGRPRLPAWLDMRDLNDLKARVVSMLILVAGVTFVDALVNFERGLDVLELGAGIALVVAALTFFLRFGHGRPET